LEYRCIHLVSFSIEIALKIFDKDKKKRIFTKKIGCHDSHRPTHPEKKLFEKKDLYPITKNMKITFIKIKYPLQ